MTNLNFYRVWLKESLILAQINESVNFFWKRASKLLKYPVKFAISYEFKGKLQIPLVDGKEQLFLRIVQSKYV